MPRFRPALDAPSGGGVFAVVLATVLATGPVELHVASSLDKVRPHRPLPTSFARATSLDLVAVRGECESVHLVATAGAAPVQSLSASAAPALLGEASLPITLYREGFIEVRTPSNTTGDVGPWPDALIPTRDPETGEARNAFPVDVPAQRHQPLLVEVCVPGNARPGRYAGSIRVTAANRASVDVPVRVDVLPLSIPATSSMPVTFGLSGKSLLMGHFGEKREDERLGLVQQYARAALRHRISLHAMTMRPPVISHDGDALDVDFSAWDAEIGPFLDGTALPSGARFTAIDLRTPEGLEGDEAARYYRAVEAHFREHGWLDRLFAYVMDEPKPEQTPELVRRLDALTAAPGIRRLVTTSLRKDLEGRVDIWTPNLNCTVVKQKAGEYCKFETPIERYAARRTKGERLWWYQSCSSHGCGSGPFGKPAIDAYFTGWPSYLVDDEGAAARVMGWLSFLSGVDGELYFDTVFAFNGWKKDAKTRVDPWDSVWAFGGNGDGTLFYPGRPDRIGGKTHQPIASLRLVQVRDGLEDYELLRQLAARDPATARAIASKLAPKPFAFERSPAAWKMARAELLTALQRTAP